MELVRVESDPGGNILREVPPSASGTERGLGNALGGRVPVRADLDATLAALAQKSGIAVESDDLGEHATKTTHPLVRGLESFSFRLLVALLRDYLTTRRELNRLRTTLHRSMPSAALERLEAASWQRTPVKMLATVMFGDIQGFTSISEAIPPEALIALLNQYFSLVSGPIRSHAGVITQYQGDAFLAVFHIPAMDRNHATDAVHAALDIQRLLRSSCFAGDQKIHNRIGIASGEIAAGFVGSSQQANFTIHGDAVNLAARLEQLNKLLGTSILMSQATAMLAGRDVEATAKCCFNIAGKREPCTIFEPADQQQTDGS